MRFGRYFVSFLLTMCLWCLLLITCCWLSLLLALFVLCLPLVLHLLLGVLICVGMRYCVVLFDIWVLCCFCCLCLFVGSAILCSLFSLFN